MNMNIDENITTFDWMDQWLTTYVQPSLAEKTCQSYRAVLNILKRDCPELSQLPLQK